MRAAARFFLAVALWGSLTLLAMSFARAGDGEPPWATSSLTRVISPVVVDDDGGGEVETFLIWYERLKESGVPVRLRGICMSACGLILMLPPSQVCVESTASLGFHLAADSHGPDEPYTGALIRRHFPPAVQEWLADKKLTIARMVFMDAKTIVELGVFPACPEWRGAPYAQRKSEQR
jgi:hypothetical protein